VADQQSQQSQQLDVLMAPGKLQQQAQQGDDDLLDMDQPPLRPPQKRQQQQQQQQQQQGEQRVTQQLPHPQHQLHVADEQPEVEQAEVRPCNSVTPGIEQQQHLMHLVATLLQLMRSFYCSNRQLNVAEEAAGSSPQACQDPGGSPQSTAASHTATPTAALSPDILFSSSGPLAQGLWGFPEHRPCGGGGGMARGLWAQTGSTAAAAGGRAAAAPHCSTTTTTTSSAGTAPTETPRAAAAAAAAPAGEVEADAAGNDICSSSSSSSSHSATSSSRCLVTRGSTGLGRADQLQQLAWQGALCSAVWQQHSLAADRYCLQRCSEQLDYCELLEKQRLGVIPRRGAGASLSRRSSQSSSLRGAVAALHRVSGVELSEQQLSLIEGIGPMMVAFLTSHRLSLLQQAGLKVNNSQLEQRQQPSTARTAAAAAAERVVKQPDEDCHRGVLQLLKAAENHDSQPAVDLKAGAANVSGKTGRDPGWDGTGHGQQEAQEKGQGHKTCTQSSNNTVCCNGSPAGNSAPNPAGRQPGPQAHSSCGSSTGGPAAAVGAGGGVETCGLQDLLDGGLDAYR